MEDCIFLIYIMGQGGCSTCTCDAKENELFLSTNSPKSSNPLLTRKSPTSVSLAIIISPRAKQYQKLLTYCSKHLYAIIKIQAVWRGFQVRKSHSCRVPSSSVSSSLPRERRPKVFYESGAWYQGEWKGNCRDGYGEQR